MALIGNSASEGALRVFLGCAMGITATVGTVFVFFRAFAAPLTPFTSLKVVVLRERLSEGGGVCDVSGDAGGSGCVRLRLEDAFSVLDDRTLDASVVRDDTRLGALGFGASIEAWERLREGILESRWKDKRGSYRRTGRPQKKKFVDRGRRNRRIGWLKAKARPVFLSGLITLPITCPPKTTPQTRRDAINVNLGPQGPSAIRATRD